MILEIAIGAGCFIVGLVSGAGMERDYQEHHPSETICTHCESPKAGHEKDTLKCPCVWTWKETDKKPAHDEIHFFKPMTMERWLKYRGIEESL